MLSESPRLMLIKIAFAAMVGTHPTIAQTPDDFRKAIETSIISENGTFQNWTTEAITDVPAQTKAAMIAQQGKKIADAESGAGYIDALDLMNLKLTKKGFENLPSTMTTKQNIQLKFVDQNRWRADIEVEGNGASLKIEVIADGSGFVYVVNNGSHTIEVSDNPMQALFGVLEGIPQFSVSTILSKLNSPVASALVDNQIKFSDSESEQSFVFGFNPITLSVTSVEARSRTNTLWKIVPNSDSGFLRSYFDSNNGSTLSTLSSYLLSKRPLTPVEKQAANYKYMFKPGFGVSIDVRGTKIEGLDSKNLMGQTIMSAIEK